MFDAVEAVLDFCQGATAYSCFVHSCNRVNSPKTDPQHAADSEFKLLATEQVAQSFSLHKLNLHDETDTETWTLNVFKINVYTAWYSQIVCFIPDNQSSKECIGSHKEVAMWKSRMPPQKEMKWLPNWAVA